MDSYAGMSVARVAIPEAVFADGRHEGIDGRGASVGDDDAGVIGLDGGLVQEVRAVSGSADGLVVLECLLHEVDGIGIACERGGAVGATRHIDGVIHDRFGRQHAERRRHV